MFTQVLLLLLLFNLPMSIADEWAQKTEEIVMGCNQLEFPNLKPTSIDVMTIHYDPVQKSFFSRTFEDKDYNGTVQTFFNLKSPSTPTEFSFDLSVNETGLNIGGYYNDNRNRSVVVLNKEELWVGSPAAYLFFEDYVYRLAKDNTEVTKRINVRKLRESKSADWEPVKNTLNITRRSPFGIRTDINAILFVDNSDPACYQIRNGDGSWTSAKKCEKIQPVLEVNSHSEWYSLRVIQMVAPSCNLSPDSKLLFDNTFVRFVHSEDSFMEERPMAQTANGGPKKITWFYFLGGGLGLLVLLAIIGLIVFCLCRRNRRRAKALDTPEFTCISPDEESLKTTKASAGSEEVAVKEPTTKMKAKPENSTKCLPIKAETTSTKKSNKRSTQKASSSPQMNKSKKPEKASIVDQNAEKTGVDVTEEMKKSTEYSDKVPRNCTEEASRSAVERNRIPSKEKPFLFEDYIVPQDCVVPQHSIGSKDDDEDLRKTSERSYEH